MSRLNGNTGSLDLQQSQHRRIYGISVAASPSAGTVGTLSIQSGATVTGTDLVVGIIPEEIARSGTITAPQTSAGALAGADRVASPIVATNTGTVTITGAGSALSLTGAATATIGAASANTGSPEGENGGTFRSGTDTTTWMPRGRSISTAARSTWAANSSVQGTLAITGTGTIPGKRKHYQDGASVLNPSQRQ